MGTAKGIAKYIWPRRMEVDYVRSGSRLLIRKNHPL